eukprot:TRINITY_DN70410_c0_g1_i1.p1 TRINITY_DN70410_c0_g1~~TRINITY_DN70410_c0_g1_i1.p1  ORF type:complete len:520 (-),score=63.57 TRINITY_DN70410_c0_g1_i1:308-1867(-)
MASSIAEPLLLKKTVRFKDECSQDTDQAGILTWQDERSAERQLLEAVIVNACSFMWCADAGILPAVYHELQEDFAVTLTALGTLTFLRGLVEGIAALPMGFAADLMPRPNLICIGVLLWSAGIVACGLAAEWWLVFVGRLLNGIGLGIVQPLLCSLIADMNPPSRRGSAFGTFRFAGNIGSMVGSYLATLLASSSIFGLAGWRCVFVVFGLISGVIGLLLGCLVKDPRTNFEPITNVLQLVRNTWPTCCSILRVQTFQVILAQGAFGTSMFSCFSFFTLWLELSCFSNAASADVMAAFVFGQALASLFGGRIFDAFVQRYPHHGPPWTCILTVAAGLPFSTFIIFTLTPDYPEYIAVLLFFLFGFVIPWAGFVNNRIFSDIVPQSVYSHIFALDRCVEGGIGAVGALATGQITARFFHFDSSSLDRGSCSPEDARQLGKGIFAVHMVAGGICMLLNGGLHVTYPRDRLVCKEVREREADVGEGETDTHISDDLTPLTPHENDSFPAETLSKAKLNLQKQ